MDVNVTVELDVNVGESEYKCGSEDEGESEGRDQGDDEGEGENDGEGEGEGDGDGEVPGEAVFASLVPIATH